MGSFNLKKTELLVRNIAQQRKKDNKEFYENYLNTISSDSTFSEIVIDDTCEDLQDGFYQFNQDLYKHTKFNDLMIGKETVTDESAFVVVKGVRFYYCDFTACGISNTKFIDCFFVGCNFDQCYTFGIGVIFNNCCFMRTKAGKNSIDDMPCIITKCEFTINFINCDLTQVVAENTNFYFTNFDNVNFNDMVFIDCSLDTVTVSDSDLRNTKIVNPRFIEFYIEDSIRKTKVNKKTFLGRINFDKKDDRDVRTATEVYATFCDLFESNKISFLAGEYFYLSKRAEYLKLKGIEKVKSFFGLITCGYGERPFFSLITSFFLILICGSLYIHYGVMADGLPIIYNPNITFVEIVKCFHFSLVTFSTVGYGNVTPTGGSLYVSAVEMVLGVIMVGVWVSTLVRKMVK